MHTITCRLTDEQKAILDQWVENHPTTVLGIAGTPTTVSDAIRAAIDALVKIEHQKERKRAYDHTTSRPRVSKRTPRA